MSSTVSTVETDLPNVSSSSDASTLSDGDGNDDEPRLPPITAAPARCETASTETCSNEDSSLAPIIHIRPRRPSVGATELHLQSLAAKRDRTLVYDLGSSVNVPEKRLGLMTWLNAHMPTKTRRSDGVGRIAVISGKRSDEALAGLKGIMPREVGALNEWKALLKEKERTLTWETFQDLAAKHDVRGGKWIMHVNAAIVDDLWKRLAWAFSYDKFPESCIQVSVTPIEDADQKTNPIQATDEKTDDVQAKAVVDDAVAALAHKLRTICSEGKMTAHTSEFSDLGRHPTTISNNRTSITTVPFSNAPIPNTPANTPEEPPRLAAAGLLPSRDHNVHVIALWNLDFMDEDAILAVEEGVRKLGVRLPMTYKPDIFSAVGVYRNNEWKLRPAIYSSRFNAELRKSNLESGIDPGWSFVTGSPPEL